MSSLSLIFVLHEQSDTVMGKEESQAGQGEKSLRDQKLDGGVRRRTLAVCEKKYVLLKSKVATTDGATVLLGCPLAQLPPFCSFAGT